MYGCRSRDNSFLGKEVKPCKNNRTMNMDKTDSGYGCIIISAIQVIISMSKIYVFISYNT